MTTRRRFLQAGLAGTALLAGGGYLATRREGSPAPGMRYLDRDSAAIVAALVPAVLDGVLPAATAERSTALRDTVEAFDRAVSGLSPAVQAEIGQLFGLLAFAPARIALTGVVSSWEEANTAEVSGFLARWRSSRLALLKSAYQALTQLLFAAWYGNPAAWAGIGYPGPPVLDRKHS